MIRKGAISIISRDQKHAFCSLTDDLEREDLHWSMASYGLRIHTGGEGTERHEAFLREFERIPASRSYEMIMQNGTAHLTLKTTAPLSTSGIPVDGYLDRSYCGET
jgi:hypothetical protein